MDVGRSAVFVRPVCAGTPYRRPSGPTGSGFGDRAPSNRVPAPAEELAGGIVVAWPGDLAPETQGYEAVVDPEGELVAEAVYGAP